MTITLTTSEIASLTARIEGGESIEDVIHRLLRPLVTQDSEMRLQTLADRYRGLSPELQLEALALLQQWAVSRGV